MAKTKSKLDRKTRRAIEHAIRTGMNNSNSASSAKSTYSFSGNGYLSGVSIGSLKVGSGSSGSQKEPVELPPITGELHVSRYFIDDLNFHLRVFNALMPQIDYTMVARVAKRDEMSFDQLCFYTPEDRDTFEAWMDEYLKKFDSHIDLMLPAPTNGAFPHTLRSNFERRRTATTNYSNSINAASSDDSHEEQMLEQWLWILENCEGEARHAGSFWFFAEKGDATLFKLAYS